MRELPLTDTELRIVRGMIDDHRTNLELDRRRARTLSRGEKLLGALVGLALVALQLATFLYTVRHG